MTKVIAVFIVAILLSPVLFAQEVSRTTQPFASLVVDSIVFYDFNKWTKPNMSIVDTSGKRLNKFEKSKKLDFKTAIKLSQKIMESKSYGGNVAACFDPHLGIVYYTKGEIVAYINVCMDCNRLEPSMKLEAQDQGKQTTEEGDVYYTRYGMSNSFRKYLNSLLKKYDFSHQVKSVPSFY